MLGQQRQAGLVERGGDALLHLFQAADRGEQAQGPAAGGQEQLAISARHLVEIVLAHVAHHQNPGVRGIIEGRGQGGADRRAVEIVGAAAPLGHRPVGVGIARAVEQGGRGHHHAVGRLQHRFGEGMHRIDPMAMETDIEIASVQPLDGEPVDEFGRRFGLQAGQHRTPGAERGQAAPFDRAGDRLDAAAGGGLQFGRLVVEQGQQFLGQQLQRIDQGDHRGQQGVGHLRQAIGQRTRIALQAVGALAVGGAPHHVLAHQGEELFGGALWPVVGHALVPARRGEGAGGVQHVAQGPLGDFIVADQFLGALPEPARPAGAAVGLGAQQPAAQLGGFRAGQFGGEGAVGGVEQMMALVEHIAGRGAGLVETAERRLHHHQRVVGDHDVGASGAAHGLLDEAFAEMGAAGIDALAAPVRQGQCPSASEQLDQPARQVAAHHVAVARAHRPGGDQAQGDASLAFLPPSQRFLVVQQAEIILAAFADHHFLRLHRRVGMQARQFGIQLPLQIAGVGADPDRGAVALGPEAGRGDIAQRLAGAGAGFGQHQIGQIHLAPWREGHRRGRGVVGLARALLGAGAQ